MKFILFFAFMMSAAVSSAGPCENMIKQVNPTTNVRTPTAIVGKLSFQAVASFRSTANSCSFGIKNEAQKRFYSFYDDGSIVVQDEVSPGVFKYQSMMLLPQEKGKNFALRRNGKMVSVFMNGGEFSFDTSTGRLVSSPSIDVQETTSGIEISNPRALLVDFGTMTGKNPKEEGTSTVVKNRASVCTIKKSDLLNMSTYDKNIKFPTAAAQKNFFQRACSGTRFDVAEISAPAAGTAPAVRPAAAPPARRQTTIEDAIDSVTDAPRDFSLPEGFGRPKRSYVEPNPAHGAD